MLPADTIQRLSDHFGHYVIEVRCRKCAHRREIYPNALAKIFGWNAEFTKVAARFRCSKCHARNVDVQIAFDRKPKQWSARSR